MVESGHVLTSRWLEIADLREQALADAIAAETGIDDPQQRIVAAQLASVHRVLFQESTRRLLAGHLPDEIRPTLAASARHAFDLLEPSLGDYGVPTRAARTPNPQWGDDDHGVAGLDRDIAT